MTNEQTHLEREYRHVVVDIPMSEEGAKHMAHVYWYKGLDEATHQYETLLAGYDNHRITLWAVDILTGDKNLFQRGHDDPDNDDAADAIDYDIIKQCTRVVTGKGDVRLLVAPEDDGGFRIVALDYWDKVSDLVMSKLVNGYQWCLGPAETASSTVWHTLELALDFGMVYMSNMVTRHKNQMADKRQQARLKSHLKKQDRANCNKMLLGLGQGRYTYEPHQGVHATLPLPAAQDFPEAYQDKGVDND